MTRLLMTAGVFVLMIAVFLFSIVFHEVSHGYVAYRLGDPTAKESGRLTLNPLKHLDPMGVIFFVAMIALFHIGIGWAKPVPIDPRYFRHPRRDILLVSIAGPGANFVLAVLGFALFYVWRIARAPLPGVADILELLVVINMLLMVFNLIPIPPLDGSHVVGALLPPRLHWGWVQLGRYGFLLLFALLWTGFLGIILRPFVTGLLWILLS